MTTENTERTAEEIRDDLIARMLSMSFDEINHSDLPPEQHHPARQKLFTGILKDMHDSYDMLIWLKENEWMEQALKNHFEEEIKSLPPMESTSYHYASDQIHDYHEMRHHAAKLYGELGTETIPPPPEPKDILKWISHGYKGGMNEEQESMMTLLEIICGHESKDQIKNKILADLMGEIIYAYHISTDPAIWMSHLEHFGGMIIKHTQSLLSYHTTDRP